MLLVTEVLDIAAVLQAEGRKEGGLPLMPTKNS